MSDVSVQESLVNDVSYDSPGTDPRANVSYDSPGSQTPVINQLQYPLRYLLSSVCLFVPGSWFLVLYQTPNPLFVFKPKLLMSAAQHHINTLEDDNNRTVTLTM